MSIGKVTAELKREADLHSLKMSYEDGGKTEVWSTLTKTIRVRTGAKPHEIREAFEAAA